MQESDVFIFDILNEGLGTQAELAIVLGMKHQAQETIKELENLSEKYMLDVEGNLTDTFEILQELIEDQQKILDKPVFCTVQIFDKDMASLIMTLIELNLARTNLYTDVC